MTPTNITLILYLVIISLMIFLVVFLVQRFLPSKKNDSKRKSRTRA